MGAAAAGCPVVVGGWGIGWRALRGKKTPPFAVFGTLDGGDMGEMRGGAVGKSLAFLSRAGI